MSVAEGGGTLAQEIARMSAVRTRLSRDVRAIAEFLTASEVESQKASGALEFGQTTRELFELADRLGRGIFRLLVVGDVKRGKSTFINALLGEEILPADVTRCTAVLTILTHGDERRAKVYFRDGGAPESLSLTEFRSNYTLTPDEFRLSGDAAFLHVSHAVVEYPHPLLKNGIQIVDSPGLNDEEDLDRLALEYVHDCDAFLLVLSATQLLPQDERLYIANNLRGGGKTTFYLINRWDQIAAQLSTADPAGIALSETKVRSEARRILTTFLGDATGTYEERVFEISALEALRRRLANADASLEGTGFPAFLRALTHFIQYERLNSEIRSSRSAANAAYRVVHDKIQQRLPLLSDSPAELRQKIANVEPDFDRLVQIETKFADDISATTEKEARELADSLKRYLLGLAATFEDDFATLQPELKMMEFLKRKGREDFKVELEAAFNAYLKEKLATWRYGAEQHLQAKFQDLGQTANKYGMEYAAVSQTIAQKLRGVSASSNAAAGEAADPTWTRVVAGAIAVLTGDFAGGAMAASGAFTWKNIAANLAGILAVNMAIFLAFGAVLGPVGIALAAAGFGLMSASRRRKEMIRHLKNELVKQLPGIASDARESAQQGIKAAFDEFRMIVVGSIHADVEARRGELANLLQRKERSEIDRDAEIRRLRLLETEVLVLKTRVDEIDIEAAAQMM